MWIYRELSDKITEVACSYPAALLTGARQTGKTSLLRKLFPDHSFVSLDLPSYAELAETEPEQFIKQFPPPVIIDEVQYAPGLFRTLKQWIDQNRKSYGQYLLTGSQKFVLMKEVSDSLAGRCAVLELDTLSWQEALVANEQSELAFLTRGGFPELQSRPELDATVYYQSYLATYLERDVRSLMRVGQLRDFERFIRACALRSGQLLNKAELARDVGISPPTANEWLSVLNASNQVFLLEPWFNNQTKTLVKSPKLYMADSGLLCHLLGIKTEETLVESPLRGAIWESFIFSELRKKQIFSQGHWQLFFWRDQHGLEADFLYHHGGRFTLLEAKFSEYPKREDAQKLKKVAAILGEDKVDSMSILCRAKHRYPLADGVHAMPLKDIPDCP
jgi:uncharacterized protein